MHHSGIETFIRTSGLHEAVRHVVKYFPSALAVTAAVSGLYAVVVLALTYLDKLPS